MEKKEKVIKISCLFLSLLFSGAVLLKSQDLSRFFLILFFFLISFSMSFLDIKTREIPDFYHFLILLPSIVFISDSLKTLLSRLLGSLVVTFLLLIPCLATKNKNLIGGADIKYIAASSFLFPSAEAISGLVMGMMIAVISEETKKSIRRKNGKKEEGEPSFPLIPYLFAGYVLNVIIFEIFI